MSQDPGGQPPAPPPGADDAPSGWGPPAGATAPAPGQSTPPPPPPPPSGTAAAPGWASPTAPPGNGWGPPAGPSPAGPPAPVPPVPAAPGWGQPGQPAGQQWGPAAGQHGWGQPAWVRPEAKPGVVALRPLGVGELLDGAVATLRRDPGPMLGLSAVVAVLSTVLQLVATWAFFRDVAVIEEFGPEVTGDQLVSTLSDSLWLFAAAVVIGFLSTVLLTGVLTVVVSRAVLGQRMGVREAWRAARPRLLKLAGLTLLFGLVVSLPVLGATLLAVLTAAAGAPGGVVAAVAVVLVLLAVPLTIWIYVRFALATPAFMLETTSAADGRTRPATVLGALQRSAGLVRGAWWRTFGILLLALVITFIVSQVLAVPAALPGLFGGPFVEQDGTPTLLALVVQGIAGVLATTVTAPFTAALTVLLYVDRRIRREGLDIELARAAGVRIPGRTDAVPPPPRTA